MRGPAWRLDDEDGDPELTGTPSPLLVTVRGLEEALVRTWRTWVGAAALGLLLGVGILHVVPQPATATATLLMVSPNPGDASAMTTDISLLQTRAVAQRVLSELQLTESPETFLSAVTATPVSSQVMVVSVDGPDTSSAVARTTSLLRHFLAFRQEQLRSVSDGLVTGYGKRITALQARVADLTREYDRVAAGPAVRQVRLGEIVSERAALGAQITDLQRASEDATLKVDAAVSGTQVIDEPTANPPGQRRQLALFGASGALLGGCAAIGVILFRTVTSERLHRRRDVASALGVPILVGVGAIPSTGSWGRLGAGLTTHVAGILRGRPRRWTEPLRRRNLEALVQGLESAVAAGPGDTAQRHGPAVAEPPDGGRSGPTTLGVAAIDRTATAARVLRVLADRLVEHGVSVLLVDLTASGALVGRTDAGTCEVTVDRPGLLTTFRPTGDPALASGPRRGGGHRIPSPEGPDELNAVWDRVEVVLALAEVDPGLDLDVLATWVDRVIPLVSAGRATRELLTTIATLLVQAGVDLPFALLEGADRRDQTLGRPSPPAAEPAGTAVEEPAQTRAVQSR